MNPKGERGEGRGERGEGRGERGGVRKDKKTSLYSLLKVKQVCVEEKKPPPLTKNKPDVK